MQLKQHLRSLLGDLHTPISLYLKLRDHFPMVVLLESNEFHQRENSRSFICCESLCSIRAGRSQLEWTMNGVREEKSLDPGQMLPTIRQIVKDIQIDGDVSLPGIGFFGYFAYDAVRYCDTIEVAPHKDTSIPDIALDFYRHVIIFDHFTQTIQLVEHFPVNETSRLIDIERILGSVHVLQTPFETTGPVDSNMDDETYSKMVTIGKNHCQRGDVFQVVLSRQFSQPFKGDDFNVYRSLRTINPSPYLFYFDYGSFRLFGSSPESQLIVKDGIARISPIAGTYPRSEDDVSDHRMARQLGEDEKELAEHTMLVDLARNDLNRHGKKVRVTADKEIHMYSHVMHMVSEVEADIAPDTDVLGVFADCFPAGTLSGAPKYRAMEIIRDLEPDPRGYYGGAIGYFGLGGEINTAIMIRSFLSRQNTLILQAGAGVVVSSNPQNETAEVHHKLEALIKAVEMTSKPPLS